MAKQKTPTEEKLTNVDFDLFEALAAIDRKDYSYYDTLTDEQKKKFVPFLLVKWFSTVKASVQIQQYHILSTNEFTNKYLFNDHIQKHPKLQWLMLCAAGLGNGKQFHQYIKNKELVENDKYEFVKSIYPNMKIQDLNTLSEIITIEEIEKYINDSGN